MASCHSQSLCYTSKLLEAVLGDDIRLSKAKWFILIAFGLVLAGCQRQNEVELTLVAQNISLETQIAEVRQTATVDAERLQITLEYMGTLVGRAEGQQALIQATQVARVTQGSLPLATPFMTVDAASLTTPQDQALITPTPNSGQPGLTDVVMAPGVGSNDCALNPTSAFSTSTEEIYVVATGVNIPAGTNIAARFSIAGQEIRHEFTPDFAIDGNCLWFFIDQNDLIFTAGTWSVTLELNNVAVTSPIAFTIADSG
jgi:hypothetical protein